MSAVRLNPEYLSPVTREVSMQKTISTSDVDVNYQIAVPNVSGYSCAGCLAVRNAHPGALSVNGFGIENGYASIWLHRAVSGWSGGNLVWVTLLYLPN